MQVGKLLSSLLLLLVSFSLSAQDIHFTQFNMSPLTTNPANIGAFEGTVRIGGIYRSQWSSILKSNKFSTPSAFVDAPIFHGFRKKDWIAIGLVFFKDQAGALSLTQTAAKLGGSYHLALDKKANTVLSIGAQWGQVTRRINPGPPRFEDGYLNAVGGQDYGTSQDVLTGDKHNYTDIDGGITLTSKLNKMTDFNIGFSMYHINTGNYSVLGAGSNPNPGGPTTSTNSEIPRRMVFHGQFNAKLTDRVTLSPTFLYQTMSKADEIILQGQVGYLFNEERDLSLRAGVGYRLRDAAQVLLGFKQKDLTVGFAYDINTSQLVNATNYRGGFEIAANYIVKIYKPAVVKPKVLCPRFKP